MFGAADCAMAVDLDRFYPTHQAGVGNHCSRDYRAIHLRFNCALCINAPFIFALGGGFNGHRNES